MGSLTVPYDVIVHVCRYLCPNRLASLTTLCSGMREAVSDDCLWDDTFRLVFPFQHREGLPLNTSWREFGTLCRSKEMALNLGEALVKPLGFFRGLFSKPKQCRIIMTGLENAGKSAILRMLRRVGLEDHWMVLRTIGFDVESLDYKHVNLVCWDTPASGIKLRPLLCHYYANTNGYIVVVDANDQERMPEVKEEIQKFFTNDLFHSVPLLVFANKTDLPFAVPTADLATTLGLHEFTRVQHTSTRTRITQTHIQPCCAPTGEGLYEGLLWLREAMAAVTHNA